MTKNKIYILIFLVVVISVSKYDEIIQSEGLTEAVEEIPQTIIESIPDPVYICELPNINEYEIFATAGWGGNWYVGLKTKDTVPKEIKFGAAYKFGRLWQLESVLCAFEITYRDKDLNLHFGSESWFYKHIIALRFGANNRELTSGVGFNLKIPKGIGL